MLGFEHVSQTLLLRHVELAGDIGLSFIRFTDRISQRNEEWFYHQTSVRKSIIPLCLPWSSVHKYSMIES